MLQLMVSAPSYGTGDESAESKHELLTGSFFQQLFGLVSMSFHGKGSEWKILMVQDC